MSNAIIFLTFTFRQLLEEMKMISTFNKVLSLPYISTVEQLIAVLEETDTFSKSQIANIERIVANRR
jgi:vesicle-fusing ATPase